MEFSRSYICKGRRDSSGEGSEWMFMGKFTRMVGEFVMISRCSVLGRDGERMGDSEFDGSHVGGNTARFGR